LLAAPVHAFAAPGGSCTTSPDNPSVNQYCESVPTTNGTRGSEDKPRKGAAKTQGVTPAIQKNLSSSKDGQVILRGLQAAQPAAAAPTKAKHKRSPSSRGSQAKHPASAAPDPHPAPRVDAAELKKFSAGSVFDGLPPLLVGAPVIAAMLCVLLGLSAYRRRSGA
jgi:hypothetical protein